MLRVTDRAYWKVERDWQYADLFRGPWGEFSTSRREAGLEYRLGDEDGDGAWLTIGIPWVGRLHLRVPAIVDGERGFDSSAWGFTRFEDGIHLHWGTRTKVWPLPFISWEWLRTEAMGEGGYVVAVHERGKPRKPMEIMSRLPEVEKVKKRYPYSYKLRSGEIQKRTATVYAERRTWTRKWFPWLTKSRTTLSIEFDGEVGEKTGSWKGGTVGCVYELRRDETWEQCLRRMERERAF